MVRGIGERARTATIAYLSSSGGAITSHPSDEPGDAVLEAEVRDHLRSLAVDYAAAVDDRDPDLLRSLFTTNAVLTVESRATGEVHVRDGIDAIAHIPDALAARYPLTFHLLGQSRYAEGARADEATGEVLCEAHHHVGELGAVAVDRVLHIRYLDRYARHRRQTDDGADRHGGWRISARTVQVQFTTEQPIPEVGT